MGYRSEAVLIVGIVATEDDFVEEVILPGCLHKHSSKFCPECGESGFKKVKKDLDGWDGENYMGLSFVHNDGQDLYGILGIEIHRIGSCDYYDEVNKKKILEAMNKVKKILKDSPFKNREIKEWILLYESY